MSGFELKLYPSGLLGAATLHKTAPVDIASLKSRIFHGNLSNLNDRSKSGNPDCSELKRKFEAANKSGNLFDLYETAIDLGVDAFGTKNIGQWLLAQEASPDLNNYLILYLEDTFRFILEGKLRRIANASAGDYITTGPKGHSIKKSPYLSKLLGQDYGATGTITFEELVIKWLQIDGGGADMIYALDIMFGQR